MDPTLATRPDVSLFFSLRSRKSIDSEGLSKTIEFPGVPKFLCRFFFYSHVSQKEDAGDNTPVIFLEPRSLLRCLSCLCCLIMKLMIPSTARLSVRECVLLSWHGDRFMVTVVRF